MRTTALFLATAFAVALVAPPMRAEQIRVKTYRNENYAFNVDVQPGWLACISVGAGADHGVRVVLGSQEATCDEATGHEATGRAFVAFGAEFNTVFARSIAEHMRMVCNEPGSRVTLATARLRISARPTMQCMKQQDGDWIDIILETHAGRWPGKHVAPEDDTARVIYQVWLRTTAERLTADMRNLEKMVPKMHVDVPNRTRK